ncbi:MAG: 4'-phosphopantetheinyl transferase family protein [Alloprevotella sp.]
MYFSEQDILNLPPFAENERPTESFVCVWHTKMNLAELSDFCNEHVKDFDIPTVTQDKQRSGKHLLERLSVRLMLHLALGKSYALTHKPNGAPQLSPTGMKISISHTRETYALMLSPLPCGIDVERWTERTFRLRERFLLKEELRLTEEIADALLATTPQTLMPETARQQAATLLWSAKEAAFKALNENTDVVTLTDILLTKDSETTHKGLPLLCATPVRKPEKQVKLICRPLDCVSLVHTV